MIYELCMFLLPFCDFLYLYSRIYASLKSFRQRQPSQSTNSSSGRERRNNANDVKKTFILFWIVVVFVVCHALRIILNVDEFVNLTRFKEIREKGCSNDSKTWVQIAVPINQLLITFNSSANFFIYCIVDPAFQNVLRQAFVIRSVIQRYNDPNIDQNGVPQRRNETSGRNETENIELSNMNRDIRV